MSVQNAEGLGCWIQWSAATYYFPLHLFKCLNTWNKKEEFCKFYATIDHPMQNSPSKKSNMMTFLHLVSFLLLFFKNSWTYNINFIAVSKIWAVSIIPQDAKYSVSYEQGLLSSTWQYVLPMWAILCSSWASSSDLSFHGASLCSVAHLGSQAKVRKYCSLSVVTGFSEVAVVRANDEFAIQNVFQNICCCIWADHLTFGFPDLLGQVSNSEELDSEGTRNTGQIPFWLRLSA